MTYWGYILGFFLIIILLVITLCLLRYLHDSYLRYVDSFLVDDNYGKLEKLYHMFRTYVVLGGILGVAFALIKSNYILSFTANYFYLYFLSSCFFLFIARTYTTTDLISSATHGKETTFEERRTMRVDRIRRHMSHINFLAFFGIITGILGSIVFLAQNPESIILLYEKVFFLEIAIPKCIATTFIIIVIPSIFSLGELALILIRNNRTTT